MLDVTQADLDKLADICHIVTSRYVGKPKDIRIFADLKNELETRCHDAGFIVEVRPKPITLPDGTSVWQPDCAIVGRVDKADFDPERIAAEHADGNRHQVTPGGIIL